MYRTVIDNLAAVMVRLNKRHRDFGGDNLQDNLSGSALSHNLIILIPQNLSFQRLKSALRCGRVELHFWKFFSSMWGACPPFAYDVPCIRIRPRGSSQVSFSPPKLDYFCVTFYGKFAPNAINRSCCAAYVIAVFADCTCVKPSALLSFSCSRWFSICQQWRMSKGGQKGESSYAKTTCRTNWRYIGEFFQRIKTACRCHQSEYRRSCRTAIRNQE